MKQDRFGNPYSADVPYARGTILSSTEDDIAKLRTAWRLVRQRIDAGGEEAVFNLSGLERSFTLDADDSGLLDDEIAPALFIDELTRLGLAHLGGNASRHDIMMLNRLTAALWLAADVMIEPGDKVIGVSPRYSHPAVVRAVAHAGGTFFDTAGVHAFEEALSSTENVTTVVLTRLSVSYEILSEKDLHTIVALAREADARIIVDDAGGARVGPAVFGQTKSLQLGVDVAATGLDKYGTTGPRLGLLAGDTAIVNRIRARAFEMGMEARPMLYPAVVRSLAKYRPQRVRDLVETTKTVAAKLRTRVGANRLFETPVTVQLMADDLLELAMERGDISEPPVVPYEATAALAMLLLRDYGILSVHFAGLPPGTAALMIKFLPPETLARFGGPAKLADAIDASITELGRTIADRQAMRELLLGSDDVASASKSANVSPDRAAADSETV
jgi:L-seryl-tRNA(Ser) seleniumtransferase